MTKLATELYQYFKDSGEKTFKRSDCMNVVGITLSNLDGILDELVRDGKIIVEDTHVHPEITLKD